MKKIFFYLCIIFIFLQSCTGKKLTEVVEVPLPNASEKISIGNPDDVKADRGAFEMISLPYKYDALQPNIDALTLENHYSKHYLTYTNNLNKSVADSEEANKTIEEVLSKLDITNENLRNSAGGFYNHNIYWESLGAKNLEQPKDTLLGTINRDFGSYDNFVTVFKDSADKQFGSGWTWLIVDKSGKLVVTNTQNQDNPLMPKQLVKGTPILAIDLWEHAYYLDYQYKRKKYIEAFFNVINWKEVGKKYEATLK
ncbi:MAG: superoxide dismutase [Flavobacterium sp.]|nr:superoxide dismutase [Flavobacterium sp.]